MDVSGTRRVFIHSIAILSGIIAGYSLVVGVIVNPLCGFVVAVAVTFVVDSILLNSMSRSR